MTDGAMFRMWQANAARNKANALGMDFLVDPIAEAAFKAEDGRICKCGAWVFDGDGCDTCNAEAPGPVDRLAESYSPDIEHFKGRGFRVAVWPQGPRAPLIEIGWAKTWNEAVALLVTWGPS